MINWKEKLRAAGVHVGISAAVALIAALLVFTVWYPYPYREISGGRELFLLVVAVDVVLGPLMTFVIFNRRKPRSELLRDLSMVALIQLGGLGYGLWTVFIARPVHLVFEIDRFRVVHAVDVDPQLLERKHPDIQAMPLLGATMLAVRPFKNSQESFDATMAALQGVNIGSRPDLWQPYSLAKLDVLKVAKPASDLKMRFPARGAEIDAVLLAKNRRAESMAYVPMMGRNSFWTSFVDPVTAEVVAFMPLDSF